MPQFPVKDLSRLLNRQGMVPALLIAALAIGLYGPFLRNPLVFDDVNVFDILDHGHYLGTVFSFDFRWIPYVSMEWIQVLLGNDIAWQRLANLALHLANGLVLFLFLNNLFRACLDVRAAAMQAEVRTGSRALF